MKKLEVEFKDDAEATKVLELVRMPMCIIKNL